MRLEPWLYKLPLLFRGLFRRDTVERELDEELEFHIEQQARLYIEDGVPEDEAWRLARQPFKNIEVRKEYCRDSWVVATLDRLERDVRHALRTLRRDWRFTVGVFLLLTLGIGANVAVFSLVNGILLEPLPYQDSDRLFAVREKIPERDSETRSVNPLHYLEWTECSCFDEISLSEYVQSLTLTGNGDPTRISALRVTPNAFSMLGVVPQLGRNFLPEDAEPGKDKVVVLSDAFWRERFASDPEIVGKTVGTDAGPFVVIGVLPPDFRYHGSYATDVDAYGPWPLVIPPWWEWTNNYSYTAVARLADGVSAAAALEQLNSIQASIASDHFAGDSASLTLKSEIYPLKDWVTSRSRTGLYVLLAAVGAMLLVACLNIANLMFVRATNRSAEAGLRAALGASRLAIFRSIFIESALLAAAGAVAGAALAWAALATVKAAAADVLPRVIEVEMSAPVLALAVALMLLSAIAFGLLPALMLTRVDPQATLREAGRSSTDTRPRMIGRQVLITAEVGLSVTVLIVAGLLLASFLRLDAVDRGFDATNVLTAELSLPAIRYRDNESKTRFWNELLDELGASPGVVAAGLTSILPLRGNFWGSTAIREGERPPASEHPSVQYRFISAGYMRALGLPVLAGRALEVYDYDRGSAVVSESTARMLWNDANPLGRRFHWNDPDDLFEVVGVVPDVHSQDLGMAPTPIVYRPFTASGDGGLTINFGTIAIRTESDPAPAAGLLRRIVASVDEELSISNVQTMQQIDSASLGARRFQLRLIGAFAVSSLLIAGIGIYGVLAYVVSARTHELAMRMALGAQRSRIMRLVISQGMRPVVAGLVLGIVAATGIGRAIASLLYVVEPTDTVTLVSVVALTLLAALAAAVLPARKATQPSLLESLQHY